MRFCAVGNIRGHPCRSLHFGNGQMGLPKPERTEWNHEHTYPLQAVPLPAWQYSAERDVNGASGKPKRLTRRTLAKFPNKSVEVKMQQSGRGNNARENAFDRVHSDMRIDVRNRAVGQNEAHIKSDQRTAPSKHESHKPANVAVFRDTIAIIDQNQREVLHIVQNFK